MHSLLQWIIEANFSSSCRIETKEPPYIGFNIVTVVDLCQTQVYGGAISSFHSGHFSR